MTKAHVLIVEDELIDAIEIENRLKAMGYAIAAVASSGEDAIRLVAQTLPDLVLMDILLEGEMDGVETTEQICERFDVPVIYLTSFDDEDILQRARITEPFGYLLKPFGDRELHSAIEIALYKHKTERRLRESEARYRHIVQDQTELICRYLPDGTLTFVNEACCRYFDKSPEELIGKRFFSFIPKEEQLRVKNLIASKGMDRPFIEVEHRVILPHGAVRWNQWRVRRICDISGHIVEFQGTGLDITERKQVEKALQYRVRFENLIADISTTFINLISDDIDQGINQALKTIGKFVEGDRSYVFLVDETENLANNTHEWCAEGIAPQIHRLQGLSAEKFPWFAQKIRNREVIHVTRAADLPPQVIAEKEEFEYTCSLIIVPMVYGGNLFGFLGFDSVKKEKNWTQEDIVLLKTVGNIFVNALKRKQTEEALRKSEERFRTLVENQGEGVGIIDPEEQFIFANPAAENIFGVLPGTLVERNLKEFVDSEQLAIIREQTARRRQGKTDVYEFEITRPEGEKRSLLVTATPQLDDKRHFIGSLAVFRNITERKHAEQKLQLFKTIIESSREAITMANSSGQLIYINPAYEKLFGRSFEDVKQLSPYDYYPPESVEIFQREIAPAIAQGESWEGELDMFDSNGHRFPLWQRTGVVLDEHGRKLFSFDFMHDITERKHAEKKLRDYHDRLEELVEERTTELVRINTQLIKEITERKQAEEALTEHERWLAAILKSMGDGVIATDKTGAVVFMNPVAESLTGWKREEALGKSIVFNVIDEKKQTLILTPLTKILEESIIIGLTPRPLLLTRDGKEIPIEYRGSPIKNSTEDITGIVLVFRDITERVRTEKELHQLKKAVETVQLGVTITDPHGKIIYANPAEAQMHGYYVQDLLGKDLGIFALPNMRNPMTLKEVAEVKNRVRESVNTRKDGSIFPVRLLSEAINDTDGTPVAVVTICEDITEQKQAEEVLAEERALLRTLIDNLPDYIFVKDTQSRFLVNNVAHMLVLGATKQEELLGKTDFDIFPQELAAQYYADEQKIIHDGELLINYEEVTVDQEGRQQQLLTTKVPLLDNQGKITGLVGVCRDITERKQAELELESYRDHLEHLVEERTIELKTANEQLTWEINERKRAEEEIQVSAQRLQTVIETVGEGITLSNEAGFFEIFNSAIGKITGYTKDEANRCGDFLKLLYPEFTERRKVVERIHDVQGVRRCLNIETTIHCKDGTLKTLLVSTSMMPYQGRDWFLSVYHDITERKQAERALRESEERYRTLVETSPDAITLSDLDGSIITCNRQSLILHGFERLEEVVGKNILDFVPEEERDQTREKIRESLERGFTENSEYVLLKKDGTRFPAELSSSFIFDESGTAKAFVSVTHDITERKQAEEALQNAKEVAETANRAKSEFLASMSHELRTPLNAILGYTQILKRDKDLTEKQKGAINIMHRSGEHLLLLINDILDLSKIEAQKLELMLTIFHLPDFLANIVEVVQIRAYQKGIFFNYEVTSSLPINVYGDEKRLRQILLNLLSNAVKFTEKGNVVLRIINLGMQKTSSETQTRSPQLSPSQSYVVTRIRFQIEDTGIGIPPEQLKHIFLPFHQVNRPLIHAEGTGLGLAISQKLVQMMGGELHVETTVGQGSRFWFDIDLPEVIEENIVASAKEAEEHHVIGLSGQSQKILIADDNETNRIFVKELLLSLGFEVMEAVDGLDAFDKTLTFHPELILLDLIMPELSGFEVARQIRQIPELNDVIVLAVSANAFKLARQESLAAGCDDFIAKPIQLEEFLEKLRIHLGLEWIYEHRVEQKTVVSSLEGQEFVLPAENELYILYELVTKGDLRKLLSQLDKLEQSDIQLLSFTAKIRQFARNYQMDQMCKYLEQYVEEK